MKVRCFFYIVLALLVSVCAHAETLEEMIPAAKKYDARYLAAQAEYEAVMARAGQARSRLLPSLGGNGNLTRNHVNVDYLNSHLAGLDRDYTSADWSFQLVQPLFHLEDWAGLSKSHWDREQARCQLQQAEAELILRVAQAAYDVLYAKENLGYLEAEKAILAGRLLAAQELHHSGAMAGVEPIQIQAKLEWVTAGVLQANWELAHQRRVLESLVGPNLSDPDPISESDVEKDMGALEDWLTRLPNNPQVRAARFSLESARQDAWRAASGFWPAIDAVGSYQDSLLGPSASLPIETRNKNCSLGVKLTWNLFSGFGTLAQCQATQKNLEKAHYELQAAEREAGIQIAEAYSGLCVGLEQRQALLRGVSACELAVRAMEQGHAAGARTQMQILEARQQWLETRRRHSQVFYQMLVTRHRLQLAVGEMDEAPPKFESGF